MPLSLVRASLALAATICPLVGAVPAAAQAPTHQEMHFVYETNRARHDPPTWAEEYGLDEVIGGDGQPTDLMDVVPRPPLALNAPLTGSSRFKAQEMADNNYFDHQSQVPPGLWPHALVRGMPYLYPLATRVPATGGGSWLLPDDGNSIESIAAGCCSGGFDYSKAINALIGLIVDEGIPSLGHRTHILGVTDLTMQFIDVGAGFGSNRSADFTNYWAFHTGIKAEVETHLTGVVYDDANRNGLYDPGEGLGGVSVIVEGGGVRANAVTNGLGAVTGAAGGYSIQVGPSASYAVTCSGGSFLGAASSTVSMATANREVDCISGNPLAFVDFEAPEPGALASAYAVLVGVARLARLRRRA